MAIKTDFRTVAAEVKKAFKHHIDDADWSDPEELKIHGDLLVELYKEKTMKQSVESLDEELHQLKIKEQHSAAYRALLSSELQKRESSSTYATEMSRDADEELEAVENFFEQDMMKKISRLLRGVNAVSTSETFHDSWLLIHPKLQLNPPYQHLQEPDFETSRNLSGDEDQEAEDAAKLFDQKSVGVAKAKTSTMVWRNLKNHICNELTKKPLFVSPTDSNGLRPTHNKILIEAIVKTMEARMDDYKHKVDLRDTAVRDAEPLVILEPETAFESEFSNTLATWTDMYASLNKAKIGSDGVILTKILGMGKVQEWCRINQRARESKEVECASLKHWLKKRDYFIYIKDQKLDKLRKFHETDPRDLTLLESTVVAKNWPGSSPHLDNNDVKTVLDQIDKDPNLVDFQVRGEKIDATIIRKVDKQFQDNSRKKLDSFVTKHLLEESMKSPSKRKAAAIQYCLDECGEYFDDKGKHVLQHHQIELEERISKASKSYPFYASKS